MDEQKVIEAIKMLREEIQERKEGLGFYGNNSWYTGLIQRKIEVCKTAIEALEKQLPKKVKNVSDAYSYTIGEYRIGKCPNCENEVSDVINVCLKCRQNLDWSE